MLYIAEEGWKVISTTRILDWLLDDVPLPERSVALHFDNGWLDTRTAAMPILQEFVMTGTCYLITEAINASSEGKSTTIRTQTEGLIEKPFMTWDHAEELIGAGWEIGAHTATHCKLADKLTNEGDEGVIWEVESSNSVFAERLGFVAAHFAYPSGSRNERTDELLAPYYRSLRLWHYNYPIVWTFTDRNTSRLALDCQNVDNTVPFEDFVRIFNEALNGDLNP